MTINRTENQTGPATLTVFFAPDASAPSQGSAINERVETIEMKHKHESAILRSLMELTNAQQVKPTEEEVATLAEIEAQRIKSEEDRARGAAALEIRKREKAMLDAAKASVI
jgi:large subunit ribosomal protein MRP49